MHPLGVHVRCKTPEMAALLAEVLTYLDEVDPGTAEQVAGAGQAERVLGVVLAAVHLQGSRDGLVRLAAELLAIAGRMG